MKVREVILANWPLKFWSLVIGVLIYLGIHSLIQDERRFEIPLRIVLTDQRFHLEQRTQRVAVILKGPRARLEDINQSLLTAQVRLENELDGGGSAGKHQIPLKRGHLVQLPRQIDVEFVTRTVEIELVQVKTVKVPVKPVVEFDSPFEVSLRYPHPQLVTVRGPQDVVENLEAIETLPARDKIEYTSITQVEADLVTEVEGVSIQVSPSRVTLHLNVSEKQEEHVLSAIHIGVLTNPDDTNIIELQYPSVDLVVTGPPRLKDGSLLKELDPKAFMAFVDVRDLPVTDPKAPPARKILVSSKYGDEIHVEPRDHQFIRVTVKAP